MFLWLKSHKKLVNNVFLLVKCVHAKKKKKRNMGLLWVMSSNKSLAQFSDITVKTSDNAS